MASAFRCRNKKQAPRCGAGHVCHPGRGDTFLRPKDANRAAGAKQPRPKDAELFVTRRVTPFCARRAQCRAGGTGDLCDCTAVPRLLRDRNCRSAGVRPRKLHIPRPAASGRSRPFRCSSSPNSKRFAGLLFGSISVLPEKSMQKRGAGREIALTRRKTNRYILRIIVTLVVKERPSGDRQIGFPERTIHCANRYVSAR